MILWQCTVTAIRNVRRKNVEEFILKVGRRVRKKDTGIFDVKGFAIIIICVLMLLGFS